MESQAVTVDHFISTEPPSADVRRAMAEDLSAIANYEHEPPLSIEATMRGTTWLAREAYELITCVGSAAALESLDAEPHPVEELDVGRLDPQAAELARQLADLITDAPLQLDAEMVTIVNRLLRRLAAHPDTPLQRRAAVHRIAAAVVWVAMRASGMVGARRGTPSASLIWDAFDTSTASDIGHTLAYKLRDLPADDLALHLGTTTPLPTLADPALLHSRHRRSLIDRRHELKRYIRDQQKGVMQHHPIQIRSEGGVRFATKPTTVRWAVRSQDKNGRATVMIANGDLRAMDLTSISVPDAYRLIAALEHALSEPLLPSA